MNIIMFTFSLVYFIGWIVFNIKQEQYECLENEEYLKQNEYYIEGTIMFAEHLNATVYLFHIDIDSIAIKNKYVTDDIYWGIINNKTKQAILFAGITLYDEKASIKSTFPNKVSINTKNKKIFYFQNDSIIGERAIQTSIHIAKRKFEKRIKPFLQDNEWEKF